MPMISLTPVSNKAQGFTGEYKLVEFGPYSMVILWEVDLLRVSAELKLRTAAIDAQLPQPSPVHGKASVTLSGEWRDVGDATVTVAYDTKTGKLTIDGKVTYQRAPGSMVTLTINECIPLS